MLVKIALNWAMIPSSYISSNPLIHITIFLHNTYI